jgi:hypothetical protein
MTLQRAKRRCAAIFMWVAMCVSIPAATAAADEISAAAAPRWGHYRDRNLGLEFDFPAHIFSLKSAEEGSEGVTFVTADGRARIRVFGMPNAANDTPARYLRRIARPEEGRFTYVRTTSRFFVASGTRDGMIFYRRCNFSRDKRLSCFQFDYPQSEKRAWDSTVTRVSLSLRASADR